MARGWKFYIKKVEELYYPCSENKGADQLRSYCEADLRLCFRINKMLFFSLPGTYHNLSQWERQIFYVLLEMRNQFNSFNGIDPMTKTIRHYLLTYISMASFLRAIGKQYSPRWDAAECGVPSGAILFA